VRYFNHHSPYCQRCNQSLGAGAVFGIQVAISFVGQIHPQVGSADDFLQTFQLQFPSKNPLATDSSSCISRDTFTAAPENAKASLSLANKKYAASELFQA